MQYRSAVILSAPEVSTLNALKTRLASTLFPELNKAWFGESLGFSYAAREKSVHRPRHDYRFCWRAVPRTLEECCRAGWAATRPIRTEQDHTRLAL